MQNPYTERFIRAFEYLQARGRVKSQTQFLKTLTLPSSHMAAFRSGERNVTLPTITNLCLLYGVSPTYMVLGKGSVMGEEREEVPLSEMEKRLAVAEARARVLELLVAAKDELLAAKEKELSLLREKLEKKAARRKKD